MTASTAILKIESPNGNLLVSRDAKQEITPITKSDILKNINGEYIQKNSDIKFKSTIETKDDINIDVLQASGIFKIYSIVRFSCKDHKTNFREFVEDSMELYEDGILYRPIFSMILTNFACRSDTNGNQVWKLEFEEI